jgi:hypothetical protein
MADEIFSNLEADETISGNQYISGNFISSLPLELMTNRRLINTKLTENDIDNPPIIEIAFAFETSFSE